MEMIVKAFTGLFFILMVIYLGVGFIAASITARGAEDFMASCTQRMEASNMATSVVNSCISDAEDQGYELKVSVHGTGDRYGVAELTYEYKLPILGISSDHVITSDMQ